MKKFKKTALLASAAAFALGAVGVLAACSPQSNTYTIKKAFTSENMSEVPDDMINNMMYASEFSQTDVTVETKLDLDTDKLTYTLYKSIATDKVEVEPGVKDYSFKGEWEFYGSYEVNADNANEITLKVPESGKYNVYYPTVLNYQSVEKQTQGWVSSADYPLLLTRFNKWYPSKAAKTVDQPVTLDGKTMTFGAVDLTVENFDPDEGGDEEEDMSGWGLDDSALASVGAGNKALNFYSNGTYKFLYNDYNLKDEGTWTMSAEGVLTLKVGDSTTATGQIDPSTGKLALHYTCNVVSQVVQDFELSYSKWSPMMPSAS